MSWQIFDFYDLRGNNVVEDWLSSLEGKDRAGMMTKLWNIRSFGGDGLPNMITDTTEKHIKEIVQNKGKALRIFFCRGPGDMRSQITLLGGGREMDTAYQTKKPHITPAIAETRREFLFGDTTRRRPHEFPEDNVG